MSGIFQYHFVDFKFVKSPWIFVEANARAVTPFTVINDYEHHLNISELSSCVRGFTKGYQNNNEARNNKSYNFNNGYFELQ